MNKKGVNELFFGWWFLIYTIIAVGIVSGIYLNSTTIFDIRQEEAISLNGKLVSCLSEDLISSKNVFGDNFDIFSYCNLNKEVLSSNSFFVRVEISKNEELLKSFVFGKSSYEGDCNSIYEDNSLILESEDFPRCWNSDNFFGDFNLKVLSASNNKGTIVLGGKNE